MLTFIIYGIVFLILIFVITISINAIKHSFKIRKKDKADITKDKEKIKK